MKFTMKKFQLVRKCADYPIWDEKQNDSSHPSTYLISLNN